MGADKQQQPHHAAHCARCVFAHQTSLGRVSSVCHPLMQAIFCTSSWRNLFPPRFRQKHLPTRSVSTASALAGAAWLRLSGLAGPDKRQQGRRHGWRHAQVRGRCSRVMASSADTWPPQSCADIYPKLALQLRLSCCRVLSAVAYKRTREAEACPIRGTCCSATAVGRVQLAAQCCLLSN